jgi:hypothetical protein
LFPGRRISFLSPSEAARSPAKHDLGISISSLQERTLEQVADYLALLDAQIDDGVVYLKQWKSWRNAADGVELRFDQYPVPARWKLAFREPCPVQTSFLQAAWTLAGR